MIPVGDSNRRLTTPWVTYAIILVNLGVFIYMLTLPADLPVGRREEARQYVEQTTSICYGFSTYPTDADRFICRWAFQPKEFFDTVSDKAPLSSGDRWVA
ncbi:MAG: hypothetical protein AB7P41_09555, partial [Dehalococcoidia bacterium]